MSARASIPGFCCGECAECFREPSSHSEREFDGLDSGPYRVSTYDACPACGSEDLDEVLLCASCEQEIALSNYDYCAVCLTEHCEHDYESFGMDEPAECLKCGDAKPSEVRRDRAQPIAVLTQRKQA